MKKGQIRRRQLGAIVFADVEELRALERIVFPFIEKRIREEIAKLSGRTVRHPRCCRHDGGGLERIATGSSSWMPREMCA